MTNIAIENCHLYWIFPLKMVIFHSYVSLPEGKHHTTGNELFILHLDVIEQPLIQTYTKQTLINAIERTAIVELYTNLGRRDKINPYQFYESIFTGIPKKKSSRLIKHRNWNLPWNLPWYLPCVDPLSWTIFPDF